MDQLEDPNAFYSWLLRIAYTRCINFINSNWLQLPDEVVPDALVSDKLESNPILQCLTAERDHTVMASILELSPNHRSVVIFKYYDNLKIKEIALIMDSSGIDSDKIYAIDQNGSTFYPLSASANQATFKMPAEPCTIYYQDKAGNIAHTLVKSEPSKATPKPDGTQPIL